MDRPRTRAQPALARCEDERQCLSNQRGFGLTAMTSISIHPSQALVGGPRMRRRSAFMSQRLQGLSFALFVCVNAILFLRPAEIIPGLSNWPIYEAFMVAAMVTAWPRLVRIWDSLAKSAV